METGGLWEFIWKIEAGKRDLMIWEEIPMLEDRDGVNKEERVGGGANRIGRG